MSLGTVLGVWIVAIVSVASGVFVAPMASAGGTNAAGLPPVASSPFHPVGVPTDQGLGTASDSPDLAARILSAAQAAHLPPHTVFLPNLLYPARVSGGVVHPTYSTAPAPIGLGDFGVRNTSGRAVPYVIQSTSWEGSLTLDRISPFLVDSLGDAFTAQLNTVTTNTTVWGNTSGSFWIQNVIDYSPSVGTVSFLDNIWNFSSPGFQEPASTFLSYNGTPVPSVGFYFDVGPSIAQSLPFTVHLYVNTSTTRNLTTGDGNPTVRFGFNLLNASGASVGHGVYDTVQFNSQRAFPLVPLTKFMVNGARLTPTNRLLYDSEIMIGGPGGGTSTRIYDISGSESLSFLNATSGRFQNDPTAWNVGGDTGETADGISETYATAGMVDLSPGPSFVLPLWNATPGGHIGTARISGTLSPSNTFLFSSPSGTSFNGTRAAWVPSAPTGAFNFAVPPGNYSLRALFSGYDPANVSEAWANGSANVPITLTANRSQGIYTPLQAWDNAQLANLSTSGDGSLSQPYIIRHDQSAPLDPLFGLLNDYLYPMFAGVTIADTTDYVLLAPPASFEVRYPDRYANVLARYGLPATNDLQIEAYNASHVTISGGSDVSGWFFGQDFGPLQFAFPLANVVLWNVQDSLVAGNIFVSQGSSLLLFSGGPGTAGGGNVVWGNTFDSAPPVANFLDNGSDLAIAAFESGDLVYNNAVETALPALALNGNFVSGAPQLNREDWNLSAPAPASFVRSVDGLQLSGSIVGSPWQCGNAWLNHAAGDPIPYTDGGAIAVGGDACPYPLSVATYPVVFRESGLASGAWAVTVANGTESAAAGAPITFNLPIGIWSWAVAVPPNYTVLPSGGRVDVTGTTPPIPIQFNAIPPPPPPPPPPRFLLVFTEAGLMGGTWSVSLGASTLTAVAGASILFNVTAGSYDYAVLVPPGYTVLPSSGQVTAGPGPAGPISVRFLLPPPPTPIYPVTFLAAGLASATAWTVTLNGSTESSFGSSLTFEEPNGSYPYAVAQVAGYRLAPGPGSVGVRGGAASIAVTFTPINGTLNGTVNGTGVVVAVDGSAVAIVGGSFSVSLAPGTHTVTATGPGFAPYYNSVAIVPAQSTHLAIALTALPQPANTGLTPAQFDGILGGLLIVAVAVLVIGLLSRGRRGGGGGTTPPPGASVRAPKIDPVPASGPASAGETKADWSEA